MKILFQSLFHGLDFFAARSSRKKRITFESLPPCKPRRSSTSVSRSTFFRTHLQKKSARFTTLFQENFICVPALTRCRFFNVTDEANQLVPYISFAISPKWLTIRFLSGVMFATSLLVSPETE